MGKLCTSACILALAISSPTLAQGAAAPADFNINADDGGRLDDIIVTAQRRSENLQKVPIAVTAISQEPAAKLNIKDLQTMQIKTQTIAIMPVKSVV